MTFRLTSALSSLALVALALPASAQEDAAAAGAADPALEARIAALEEQIDDIDDREEWQVRIHGGWVDLDEDYDDDPTGGEAEDEDGWVLGFDLFAPVWTPDVDDDDDARDGGDGVDLPLQLYWRFTFDYLQIDDDFRDGTTGDEDTVNAIELLFGPVVRFPLVDGVVTPYVYGGAVFLIASLPWEEGVELDLGGALGAGIEFRVHPRFGVGADYRYVWYGVADAEEFDHHTLTGFVSFYF